MLTHDIIVIGASAGGVEALVSLVRELPADLPAAVFVVIHFPAHGSSVLPQILNRAGQLSANHAQDGEAIQPGRIYVAAPDLHLVVHPGVVRVVHGPRENHCRPAIDPLFRSATLAYGSRVVGVILSGTLGDGTAGLAAVKEKGGIAIVQEPSEALFPEMPRNALQYVDVDYTLPLTEISSTLVRLAHEEVRVLPTAGASEMQQKEVALAEADMTAIDDKERPGIPSVFACPECGGTLWELEDGELLRFRCRIGHAFSSDSLLSVQAEALENALWAALRGLEENAALAQRMADRARERQFNLTAKSFEERAWTAKQQAAIIRQVLVNSKTRPTPDYEGNGG